MKKKNSKKENKTIKNKDLELDYKNIASKVLNIVTSEFKYFDFFFCNIFSRKFYSAEKIKNKVSFFVEFFPDSNRLFVNINSEDGLYFSKNVIISYICNKNNLNISGSVSHQGHSIRDENCFTIKNKNKIQPWIENVVTLNKRSCVLIGDNMKVSMDDDNRTPKKAIFPDINKISSLIEKFNGSNKRTYKS